MNILAWGFRGVQYLWIRLPDGALGALSLDAGVEEPRVWPLPVKAPSGEVAACLATVLVKPLIARC